MSFKKFATSQAASSNDKSDEKTGSDEKTKSAPASDPATAQPPKKEGEAAPAKKS